MGRKRRLILVGFIHLDLPVAAVAVEGGDDGDVPKGVNSLVHPRDRIRVPTGQRVQASVVYTKTEGAVLSGTRTTGLAHSELDGSMTPSFNIRSISVFSTALAPCPAR